MHDGEGREVRASTIGSREGEKYGAHHSNPNKHRLEGIVFLGGLDASNPI